MNLAAHLSKTARTFGERPALTVGTRPVLSYSGLADRVARLAGALSGRFALVPDDRIAIIMTNCPAFFEVLYGAWHAGLAVAPINARLHQREFEYILGNVNAKLCFVSPDLAETIVPLVDTLPDLAEIVVVDQPDYEHLFDHEPVALTEVAPTAVAWFFTLQAQRGDPRERCSPIAIFC